MTKIFDCFRFFDEKEILQLRYSMLKDKVEKFIILEGNKTQSGHDWTPIAKSIIEELGYPKEKFILISSDLPAQNDTIQCNYVDNILASRCLFSDHKKLTQNFTRERIVIDSLLTIINNFNNDDIFFISDCDEIINPEHLTYFADVAKNLSDCVIKVPLIELQGRANFRAYTIEGNPVFNDQTAFICTKQHLVNVTPTQLRFNINHNYSIIYITENNQRIEDCGWHFSWMGDAKKKKNKVRAFSHCDDQINSDVGSFCSDSANMFFDNWQPYDGGPNPWNEKNVILKPYPIDQLPSDIFNTHNLRRFFLGDEKKIPVVGVPIVNGVHWLERLINSIDYPVKDLFIINNNGQDQITHFLDKIVSSTFSFIDKVRVLHMPSNIGVAASWNLIIKSYMMSPYWIISNNDVAFSPGFLEEMIDKSLDETCGVVWPPSRNDIAALNGTGSFECFLIKDWVINQCGLFDENFYPAYCEDVDYILKLKKRNIQSKFVNSSFYHGETQYYEQSGSQTSVIGGNDLTQKINKAHAINRKYMCNIWGNNYEDQFYLRSDLATPITIPYMLNWNRKKYLGF